MWRKNTHRHPMPAPDYPRPQAMSPSRWSGTPDTGLTSIRGAKLGNAYTGQPPQRNRVIYAALGLPFQSIGSRARVSRP